MLSIESPATSPVASAPAEPRPDENAEARLQKQLSDAIYEHRIPPGTKLPEIDLCRIYGATRGVIRKVLNRLAADQIAATGNAALEQHLRRVVSQTSLMVALYESPGSNSCSVLEHLEILDAIQARDFAKAEQLMDYHLLGCERQLRLGEDPAPAVDLAMALGAQQKSAPAVTPRTPAKCAKTCAMATAVWR